MRTLLVFSLSLSLLCEPTENQKVVVVEEDEEGFFDTIVTENKKRNDIYIYIIRCDRRQTDRGWIYTDRSAMHSLIK